MARPLLNQPHFQNEAAAFEYVEARLWPRGPVCHHCGERERVGKLSGKTTRAGLYKCYRCRKPFTIRMGTLFECSHLPLHLWLQIIHLMCASKKGISTRQIQRMLRCSMTTAWYVGHRIRAAIDKNPGVLFSPLGGEGKAVEANETYVGRKAGSRASEAPAPKQAVMALVERGGAVRSFHVPNVTAQMLRPIIGKHPHRDSRLGPTKPTSIPASAGTSPPIAPSLIAESIHTNTIEGCGFRFIPAGHSDAKPAAIPI